MVLVKSAGHQGENSLAKLGESNAAEVQGWSRLPGHSLLQFGDVGEAELVIDSMSRLAVC